MGARLLPTSLTPLPPSVAAEPLQLAAVAAAIEVNDLVVARELLERVDRAGLWAYYDAAGAVRKRLHEGEKHTPGGRARRRAISPSIKLEVAERDGWRCRYCGLRLISFDFSRKLNELFPELWVIDPAVERLMHPAAYLLRYTQDHVVAHAVGGGSLADNLVASCGTCQFQKWHCSLEELQLANPHSRAPVRDGWDGLAGRFGPAQF